MGIAGIAVLLVDLCDGCLGGCIVAEAAVEQFTHLCLDRIGHLIASALSQCREPLPNLCIVLAGQQVQQTLQIAGDQDVHGRRSGSIELTVPVVNAGADEVCKHLVDVGGTNQLADGHTHLLCIVSSQNVAEVTGGNYHVQLVAIGNLAGLCQRDIRRNVVDDLRYQTAPVDGVCAGEGHVAIVQCVEYLVIGKDFLDTALAIVKVALYGANCDILAFLCHHLALLHITDALFRIEDHDLCARNILEALQSSLTGIAGGCNQNDYLLVHMQLLHGSGQEIRQDLERHILESTGRAMPQFQHISALEQVCDLCNIFCFKIFGGIRTLGAVNQFCLCKICQILGEHISCTLCIRFSGERLQLIHGKCRNGLRNEQAALF